ncbi:Hsp20/alpha crystallin family protein [Evansella sp. AB-P1]|uniref:Hsp20/alpha crystallin family protein n=1 Tax=Evansella sp. AB-P1 TaxID=3037653 RepID=UPI0024200325|nr:Hsp20/alpha crystallin family protein [Evansella sp. AB-P1]MDG5786829.1 Hsp20/alpha crystallin family protein [Evansella sp. AB-P1]
MVNRRTNEPFGLFNFPFFTSPKPAVQFDVRETDSEIIIEGTFSEFTKDELQIEFVRNGLLIIAEKKVEAKSEEKGDQQVQPQPIRVERFVPIYFPFAADDVSASFTEENVLKIVVAKNDSNRSFITIE